MTHASNKKEIPKCLPRQKTLKPFLESVRYSHPPKGKSSGDSLNGLFSLIQMDKGYFKIWRKLREHPIWADPSCLVVFLYCLNHAEWKDGRRIIVSNKEVILKRGQLSAGRRQLGKEMGLPESTVTHCLKRLVKIYEIMNIAPNRKFSVITVLNWDRYQFPENDSEPLSEPLVNHSRTTREPLANTQEEYKNTKIQELKNRYIRAIRPTLPEIEAYFRELGKSNLEANKFFDHFQSNGWKVGGRAPMKEWKAAVRNWVRNSRNEVTDNLTKSQRTTLRGLEELNASRNLKQSDSPIIGYIS